jgi:NAD(P)-dependent dehydrogenase (short-subunit alcohol dehydrogenase family)
MGLSYAQALASAGANIAALDSNSPDERLDQIAVQYGVKVVFHKTNVTNAEEVNAVILKIEEELGSVDIWYFVLFVST